MTYRLNALAAIAFACLSSATPALADGPISMNVSTRGLRLDSAAGLTELGRRIHVSAGLACDRGTSDLASQIEARACVADLERAGAARIAELARPDVMVASVADAH